MNKTFWDLYDLAEQTEIAAVAYLANRNAWKNLALALREDLESICMDETGSCGLCGGGSRHLHPCSLALPVPV